MSRSVEYASFLVRLWREERTDPARELVDWQSEVEHIQTGERWEFNTLEGLLNFLRQEAEEGGRGAGSARPRRG